MDLNTEEAARVGAIFADAGWTPGTRDGWNGQFIWRDSATVGGVDPWGVARTTAIAANPNEGPSTLEGAAAWLVDHAKERAPQLTTPITLDLPALLSPADDDAEAPPPVDPQPLTDDPLEGALLYDADFTDAGDLGSELLEVDLEGAPLLEATERELPEVFEPAAPQDRFYGLDDLDRRRSLRIGDVVRLSRAKQAEIAARMGEHDFASIQNAILRDTVDGAYKGPQATYDLFVELSRHQNEISRIWLAEADKIAFLEAATRDEIEAFDPELDWP